MIILKLNLLKLTWLIKKSFFPNKIKKYLSLLIINWTYIS